MTEKVKRGKKNTIDQKPMFQVSPNRGGTEASAKAAELRKGGNRADGVLKRFD